MREQLHEFEQALRAEIGEAFERGTFRGPLASAMSAAWASIASRRVARRLRIPRGLRTIGVGGAVLGGAGKTPVAIAIARALAARGEPVALIAHGHLAKVGRAREVMQDDAIDDVGDDALACARALAGTDVRVVVARRRGDALALASRLGAGTAVIDAALQAAPKRFDLALLVVDGDAPWGRGACPPRGDLRAPRNALLAASDRLAAVVRSGVSAPDGALSLPSSVRFAESPLVGVVALSSLASVEVGLVTAVAHPERIEAALAEASVTPKVVRRLGDHARPGPREFARLGRERVDVWLTTARCVFKLPPSLGGVPVLALRHEIDIGSLEGFLDAFASPRGFC